MFLIWYTYDIKFIIKKSIEFSKWFTKQSISIQRRITARMLMVEETGNLGSIRYLGVKLMEFKWKSGLRVYFSFHENTIILLLHGGIKNDQQKDIKKAKQIQKRYF